MHLSVLSLCAILIASSNALRVAPTSPCLSVCGDATLTNGSDIVCNDADFANTATGRAFEECISCELNSTTFDTTSGETDLQWLLYNLRYELSWCIWGFPNATGIGDTPCVTSFACAFYKDSIEADSLSPNASTFDYCTGFNTEDITECHNCLVELNTELFLSNFFTVLQAGCSQQPFNGQKLSISGSVFSTTPISITSSSSTSTFQNTNSGPLTLGAKVGIAVGGIVFLLILSGCFIVCRGKRRRRAFLAAQNRRNQNMIQAGPFGGNTNTKSTTAQKADPKTATTTEGKNTPTPPMPPSLQTQNFEWHRPDKYPTSSPEDGSTNGEKYYPHYSSLYSSPVSGSTDGPGSAVTWNQVHPWSAGGLGDSREGGSSSLEGGGNGRGMMHGMGMGRMAVVRERSYGGDDGDGAGNDIELQKMESSREGEGDHVDMGFVDEAGKRGFTTTNSPIAETHREGMI